jgi:hypothetical protein
VSNWSDEQTGEPLIADHRNYYKVEKWTKDGSWHSPIGAADRSPRKIFAEHIFECL